MSRNNSVSALQGFSICQPFLGAALQFYPSLGTQQLDDLINSYLPGPSSIKEKRATVSMDFFEYSQLTGETFKYYPVFTQTSSAESSPIQDSGYGSSFVSPVISDWSWSQSTPSSASASTPTSVSQETMSCKAPKKVAAQAAKSQTSDFSHLPGMKIMTKDGRDVTNSASRGCKTKEQRDHAHLMRIIKACDACRKKKVRCDPSHKKRTTAQNHTAAPARLAKKVKTSPTQETRSFKNQEPQQNISSSSSSLLPEPAFAIFEQPDMSVELPESWESLVHFEDEPAHIAPFDYDFFCDPEGHLSPQSNQSPATPTAFSQPQIGHNLLHTAFSNQPFHEEVAVRPPTLPYMDATVTANNYVDFSLYSPEPSFLDEDSALVTDIGSAIGKEQDILSQHHGLAQSSPSLRSREVERNKPLLAPDDCLNVHHGTSSSPQVSGTPCVVDQGCHSLADEGHSTSITRHQCVSQNNNISRSSCSRLLPDSSPTQMVRSPLVIHELSSSRLSQCPAQRLSVNDTVNQPFNTFAELPQRGNASSPITNGLRPTVSVALPLPEPAPLATTISATLLSRSLAPADGLSQDAETATATRGNRNGGSVNTATFSMRSSSQVAVIASSENRRAFMLLGTQSHVTEGTVTNGVLSAMTPVTGNGPVFARRSAVALSPTMQLLCIPLLLVAIGIVTTWLNALAVTRGFSQFALGLAMYKAYHSDSSLYGSRPQQSRLSTTPKPQGFSNGARLLSCVSTRLRHTRRQNQKTHCQSRPAVKSRILGFAQGLP
nr:uncharacterized protein CTRU02_09308 [Colletotrichum truncatum]KAF6788987.1 hypothetical protein CTRU02_09308 [Colletotrichum truncatum]